MVARIFINYRREDSTSTAGRLYDRLALSFGRKNLFMDVDHIPPGVDFVKHLNSQVAACNVFIAVIGPQWLEVKNEKGGRRLDDPDDFVAVEIGAALARDIRVIPALVDGAGMPKESNLPESLRPLARRNAIELRNNQFGRDAEALIEKIREAFRNRTLRLRLWRAAAGVVVVALLLGWIVSFIATDRMRTMEQEWLHQVFSTVGAKEDAKQASLAEWRAKAELEELKAKQAAEAEAKAKAEQAERERQVAAKAEDARKATEAAAAEAKAKADQAERERVAAAKAEEERKAKAAEAERQRIAALKAGEERRTAELDRLIADFSEAIRLNPNDVLAFFNRAEAYAAKGYYDRAIPDYTEVIRLGYNSSWATYTLVMQNRAKAYAAIGFYDRAIADYGEVIRHAPKLAIAHYGRGVAYASKGDYLQAIANYSEAIRFDPHYALPFCSRGRAKLKIQDPSGNGDIARAREIDPSSCE